VALPSDLYQAAYRKPNWGLYKDIEFNPMDGPFVWTTAPFDEEYLEAGVCLSFNAGKTEIQVTIPLSSLLQMAKSVVSEQGEELFIRLPHTKGEQD